MYVVRLNTTADSLARILAYEYKDQIIPKGKLSPEDINVIVRGHYYGLSDDVTDNWDKELDPDQKKTLSAWAKKWAKEITERGTWEVLASDHHVSERGDTTLVLTNKQKNSPDWALLIRTTGKRERYIELSTRSLEMAKKLADIYHNA